MASPTTRGSGASARRPRPSHPRLLLLALLPALLLPVLGGCGDDEDVRVYPEAASEADLEANNRAVGLMGQFDFPRAVEVFEQLAEEHPRWLDVQVNLAIALLNRTRADTDDLGRAMRILQQVLAADEGHRRARHCTGILHLYRGRTKEALPYFEGIAREDPSDAYAAYFAGDCYWLEDRFQEALAWFERAQRADPNLRSAYHGAYQTLRMLGREDEAQRWFRDFKRLDGNLQARLAEIKYTRMGPKAMALAVDRPGAAPAAAPQGPVFLDASPLPIQGVAGIAWRRSSTPPAQLSACDVDGDGRVDLLLAGAVGTDEAPENLVLRRTVEGYEALRGHPLSAVTHVQAALWGDVDNDGLTDVYLCRDGPNQLWRQVERGRFEDVTAQAKVAAGNHETHDGALFDIDHDGDLDLLLLHADAPFEVLANKLDGTFMPLPEDAGLRGSERPATGLALGDFDGDRDADVLVLHAEPPHEVFVNDRLWAWRADEAYADLLAQPAQAALVVDADADGRPEIVVASGGVLQRWSRHEEGRWRPERLGDVPSASESVRLGVLDAQGDGALDLFVAGARLWSLTSLVPGAPAPPPPTEGEPVYACRPVLHEPRDGCAVVGLRQGAAPVWWRPGPGRHAFAALSFTGLEKSSEDMRSNASGIGVRAAVRVDSRWTARSTFRSFSGPGQSHAPLAIGLGGASRIDFVDLLWSDGLVQSELGLEAGRLHRIEETQRQTSSCPVLFAWNGSGYEFVTDLLGVGGIGFWVAPGEYAAPRPRESLLLPGGALAARDGALVLKLGEPMEEACYLDGARLVAYDLPPGWSLALDERMEVLGPPASGEPGFYRRESLPARAVDQAGRDVTAAVRRADRRAAPTGARDRRFIGLTAEQVLTLEFDRPLDAQAGTPWLVAEGWIEYPYAQTLFGAWQAGVPFEAPTLEARDAHGTWHVVFEQFGYPAGMPRGMALPLRGLPQGTRALRLRTTQEVYWDRLGVAWVEPCLQAKRRELPLQGADLLETGFALRTTGPQRLPHYDYGRRAPLWDARHQAGFHTRFGRVDELLAATDDAVVVYGPGEEVELRFVPPRAPAPEGWTRRYVLLVTGWCKDMDLFTRDGETVGPLPVRDEAQGASARRDALHARYNTRYRSGR